MLECNLASGCTVDVAGIQGWQAGRQCTVQEFSAAEQGFSNFFLAYHWNNTKHTSVPLGTVNINAYFQDTGLPECFAVEASNFAVAAFLI